ncbi:MAG: prepilin-type N-terminal cleavage/methylation domain-containing protein [Ignavibacteria bacterium]|jgi:prepilin-type N-terminal cleavage/methylation domain-containing protein|nr:prepilin-type N-terminal cleavage/methylation domain-containing protein [Ignavibacteria bacterium]
MMKAATRNATVCLRRGFTLAELLVSVAVMAIMITIVASVVAQSHKVVNTAQAMMRANSSGVGITQILRQDIARISQNGFLAITRAPDGTDILVYMTAGVTTAVSGQNGAGALTMIGRKQNAGTNPVSDVLWRGSYVLRTSADSLATWDGTGDQCPRDFSEFQSYPRSELINSIRTWATWSNGFVVPPETLAEARALWQVAATNCTDLQIMWTNGDLDGSELIWYGPASDDHPAAGPDNPEEPDAPYLALWTNHNQNNWPKAIKVYFKLKDSDAPEENQEMEYEVICPLGQ